MGMTNFFRKVFLVLLVILNSCSNQDGLVDLITGGGGDNNVPNEPASKWVLGYYVGYQHGAAKPGASQQNPSEINFAYLTHIAIGIALARTDGTLDLRFYHHTEQEGKSWALETISAAHKAKRKALLMIGGEGNGDEILSSMQNYKNQFINGIVNAVNELNFDGVDLDWEDNINGELFVELAKELRKRMPNKLITVPGFVVNINFGTVSDYIVRLCQYIDQYNIMSYHPATSWIGSGWWSWHNCPLSGEKPNTPVSIASSLDRLHKAGIPKSKLGMGLAFYAIGYSGGITGPNQPTDWGTNQIRGGDNMFPLWKLFNAQGTALRNQYRQWDSQAKVPYLSLPPDKAIDGCQYISYDDEESILEKGRFARANGYGGIIIWTISQGYVAENPVNQRDPLLKAAYDGFILGK